MSNVVETKENNFQLSTDIVESLMLRGDLTGLSPKQKIEYYRYRCQELGIDPATKPFDLLKLRDKEILYANATCTQQLVNTRNLSVQIVGREKIDGMIVVTMRCTDPSGRTTDGVGAVSLDDLRGEAKANALMKAVTKAYRRTVLSHCGLGMMDETEIETVPQAVKIPSVSPEAIPAFEDESQEQHPIFIPGKEEAYATYPTRELAADAVRALVERIEKSPRIDDKEKTRKIRDLLKLNSEYDLSDVEAFWGGKDE